QREYKYGEVAEDRATRHERPDVGVQVPRIPHAQEEQEGDQNCLGVGLSDEERRAAERNSERSGAAGQQEEQDDDAHRPNAERFGINKRRSVEKRVQNRESAEYQGRSVLREHGIVKVNAANGHDHQQEEQHLQGVACESQPPIASPSRDQVYPSGARFGELTALR